MMPGEDQERLEDYLELEHFLEELQAGRVAHPPEGLTPEKARIYRMAALLRSAVPDEAAPRAEFAAELQAKLEQEVQQLPRTRHLPFLAKKPQGRARVSRRAVLAGGAAAVAASLAVGAGLEHVVEQAASASSLQSTKPWPTPLVPASTASTWLFVTMFADLGDKAVRFASDAVVGYVIRNDGDGKAGTNEPVVAVSAACTHMGCIVQWQDADHTFHCPCHGGLFTEYGMIDKHSPLLYLKPLPRLETKVEEGKVFVRVPASQTS
ncbi:MAG TPA: Rieske (2Fe-2S) protein [Ktedonobacteraceae bacterium]|nr:Rieske (2Fe-2S) protein [Ktedonobacteraceae bacterium]